MTKFSDFLKQNWIRIVSIGGILLIVGCADLFGNAGHRQASSVMEYLYPHASSHVDTPGVPILSLPLKVGVAFVPEQTARRGANAFMWQNDGFTEKQKIALLDQVSASFKQFPFVQSIQVIPSTYLTPGGGFENLDQLRQMFDVDVVALLAYDQAQFTDENWASISYVTVVGAYIVPGERNDTKTMMDAVVYDIASRKLLFRAPGISEVKHSVTPIGLNEGSRDDSQRGFDEAATNLVVNLQGELAQFKERVKSSPAEFKVTTKPGYNGVGGLGIIDLGLFSTMAAGFVYLRKKSE